MKALAIVLVAMTGPTALAGCGTGPQPAAPESNKTPKPGGSPAAQAPALPEQAVSGLRLPSAVTAAFVVAGRGRDRVLVTLAGTDRSRLLPLKLAPDGVRSLALSPDGHRLALTTAGGADANQIKIADLRGGTERVVSSQQQDPGFFQAISWSPSGDRLAISRGISSYGADLQIIDADTGRVQHSFSVGARADSTISWARDALTVFFTRQSERGRAQIRSLDLETGTATPVALGLDPAINADGALALARRGGVWVLRRGGGLAPVPGTEPGDRRPHWTSDARHLVVERGKPGCESYPGYVCSRVVRLSTAGRSPRSLLSRKARAAAVVP